MKISKLASSITFSIFLSFCLAILNESTKFLLEINFFPLGLFTFFISLFLLLFFPEILSKFGFHVLKNYKKNLYFDFLASSGLFLAIWILHLYSDYIYFRRIGVFRNKLPLSWDSIYGLMFICSLAYHISLWGISFRLSLPYGVSWLEQWVKNAMPT